MTETPTKGKATIESVRQCARQTTRHDGGNKDVFDQLWWTTEI